MKIKKYFSNISIPRRDFLKRCLSYSVGISALSYGGFSEYLFAKEKNHLHRAEFWKPLSDKGVQCKLCPNGCELYPGDNGICHARGNRDGALYSLVYNYPSVIALDLIEKTPLYHFQVEGKVFSIATAGCNLFCKFCQNWQVSQVGPDKAPKKFYLEPKEVIKRAKKHNSNAINFFYTEPVIYYEYMRDIAVLAKKNNMKTTCITAGYINKKPLEELIPLIDAFVVGLKGFTENFYNKYIGGSLEPVKETLKILAKNRKKTWFEIVNLLVTGLNDNSESIKSMTGWIARDIGKDVPLHFTRFAPAYKLKHLSPTPRRTLKRAYSIAKDSGLEYVYLGNIPGEEAAHTFCPKCGKKVIERVNFLVIKNHLKNGRCTCGFRLPGHWL